MRLQVEHLSDKSDSFSLPAWRKWARMTTDTRNKKGWPTVFADGRGIGSMRASIYTNAAQARTCAACTPTSSTRRRACSGAPSCGTRGPRGGPRRTPGSRSSTRRCRRATSCATDRPGERARRRTDVAAARWDLQRRRDEAVGELPAVGEWVTAMYEAEAAALARLSSAAA